MRKSLENTEKFSKYEEISQRYWEISQEYTESINANKELLWSVIIGCTPNVSLKVVSEFAMYNTPSAVHGLQRNGNNYMMKPPQNKT